MPLKMPDVFTTRHNVSVSEKVHGGRAMVTFSESMDFDENIDNVPIKQNPNDWRRNSDIIDQQPTVNRFMDQQELEWQRKSPSGKPDKTKDKENNPKKKDEKDKENNPKKKDEEGEDESKYFCCS